MASLTDAAIRIAIRKATTTGKPLALSDGDGKGTGRLRLTIRPMPSRTLAEWYAVQWRDGKRTQAKLGAYPAMNLKEARERFAGDFATAIQSGASIRLIAGDKPGTVGDLFTAYLQHLEAAGKMGATEARKNLNKAAEIIGRNRQARDVSAREITSVLAPIYARGSASMADHVRGYLRAAFSWGLKADNDYRRPNHRQRFGLDRNPAADIPTEPKKVGTRWLKVSEFIKVYERLADPGTTVTPHYCIAMRVLMLTGQRVGEIVQLKADQWHSGTRTLMWQKTKNGRPHSIPVCAQAAALLDSLVPSPSGLLFPSVTDETKNVSEDTLYAALWRVRQRIDIPAFALRDLRRTWKTLAGEAGLTKEERDLLQNHAKQDVSSRHYDRWEYMPEKRAAVAKWEAWLSACVFQAAPHESESDQKAA